MALSPSLAEIVEWRGVEGIVAAEVLTDDNGTDGYTTGSVFSIAGVATLTKETESSSDTHYYDNMPAIVIDSVGSDTITITASALPMEVQAKLTGQTYDDTLGAYIEGDATKPYFALGYKTQKTNGDEVYVWRYKGKFQLGTQTHNTKDSGTDANGQELTYTGISTTHKWTKNDGKGAKSLTVNATEGKADVSAFFTTVMTPDALEAAE